MGWIVARIVLARAIVSPGFRKLLLVIVGMAGLAGVLYYQHTQRQQAIARDLVPRSEVVIDDATLGHSSGSSYRLRGRVRNLNASHTVTSLEVAVTLRDCNADETRCAVVGESTETVFLVVPPHQVRDLDHGVYFPHSAIRGEMAWSFRITEVAARD